MIVWLRRVLAAFATLMALFVLVGLLVLPDRLRVERTRVVKAPPTVITSLLHTRAGWKRWQAWVKTLDESYTFVPGTGPDRGIGMDFSWTGGPKIHPGRTVLDAWVAGERVGYTRTLGPPPMVIEGEIRLTPKPEGTEIRWSESSDLGYNPVVRWLALLGDDAMDAEFDQGLDALQKIVESDAVEAQILDSINNPEATEAPR